MAGLSVRAPFGRGNRPGPGWMIIQEKKVTDGPAADHGACCGYSINIILGPLTDPVSVKHVEYTEFFQGHR